jgi:hypothetical protein
LGDLLASRCGDGAGIDPIVAVHNDFLSSFLCDNNIIFRTSGQDDVIGIFSGNDVIAVFTVDCVLSASAGQCVVARAPENRIVAAASVDDVISSQSDKTFVSIGADERVISLRTHDDSLAGRTVLRTFQQRTGYFDFGRNRFVLAAVVVAGQNRDCRRNNNTGNAVNR